MNEERGAALPTRGGFRDLTGQRFGKLTALCPTDRRVDSGSVVWRCRCDCGKTAEVSARRLTRGYVKSCGCLSNPPPKDYVGRRFGRLTVLEYGGRKRRVSAHSAATITYWKCRCDCGREILAAQQDLQDGATLSCGCLKLERRRASLRLCDNTSVLLLEQNKKGPRSNNTSGCTGVCPTGDGRWMAYINFKKKRYYLGRYANKEDAVEARRQGERMHDDFLAWYYSRTDGGADETETEEAGAGSDGGEGDGHDRTRRAQAQDF